MTHHLTTHSYDLLESAKATLQGHKRAVVQVSGGVESTVLLKLAADTLGRENVFGIAYDTDSIFWRHRDCVAVKRVVTSLQMQQQLFICRMPQVDQLEYVRDDLYEDVGFIPGYKLLYNTAAMAYAQRVGATCVLIGNMDDNVYPDEDPSFLAANESLYNTTYVADVAKFIRFITPFHSFSKADVIKVGHRLHVKLEETVSCGREEIAGGLNCGGENCPWCSKRRAGFAESGVEDRTIYFFDRESHKYG